MLCYAHICLCLCRRASIPTHTNTQILHLLGFTCNMCSVEMPSSVCVCMHTYIHAYSIHTIDTCQVYAIYIHTQICINTYVHTYVACMHTCAHAHASLHKYICAYVCCMHTYIRAFTCNPCICMQACMHACARRHTNSQVLLAFISSIFLGCCVLHSYAYTHMHTHARTYPLHVVTLLHTYIHACTHILPFL